MDTVTIPRSEYNDLLARALPRLVLSPSEDAVPGTLALADLPENRPDALSEVRQRVTARAARPTKRVNPKPNPPMTGGITVS